MWLNNWFTTTKNTGLGDLVPETERGCNCWDGCWIQGLIQARNVLYNWAKSLIQTRLFLREAFNSTDMVALWCDFSTQQFEDSMIYLCKNTHTHTHLQKYKGLHVTFKALPFIVIPSFTYNFHIKSHWNFTAGGTIDSLNDTVWGS